MNADRQISPRVHAGHVATERHRAQQIAPRYTLTVAGRVWNEQLRVVEGSVLGVELVSPVDGLQRRFVLAPRIEDRYPIRVRCCEVRHGSGGKGRYPGGDGIKRSIEFLDSLTVSLLTSRRTTQPFGLAGGEPGAIGKNLLLRAGNDEDQLLDSSTQLKVEAGDLLTILTPGGGGFGDLANR